MGASPAAGGLMPACGREECLALPGVRIVDPRARPDRFHSDKPNPDPATVGASSAPEDIAGIGMVAVGIGMGAGSFAAIGDLRYPGRLAVEMARIG